MRSFWLKHWGVSTGYSAYLWTKFQFEILSFRYSEESYAHKPKSSKRPITLQRKAGKPNHSRAFNNSLRSIVCTHARSKSDLTVGYVPSSVRKVKIRGKTNCTIY